MLPPDPVMAMLRALQPPPQAPGTQLAGDVVPLPLPMTSNTGPSPNSAAYAVGKATAPNILPIGMGKIDEWLRNMRDRQSGK